MIPTGLPRILIIDDSPTICELLADELSDQGFYVDVARTGAEGLTKLSTSVGKIDLVLLDYNMPGLDGAQVLAQLRSTDSKVKVALFSGEAKDKLKAVPGATAVISKDDTVEELALRIKGLVAR